MASLREPSLEFRNARSNDAAAGIIAVMETGKWVTREFIVERFMQAGYCESMAERKADALIALNTDIRHWSRWEKQGNAYRYQPEFLRLRP